MEGGEEEGSRSSGKRRAEDEGRNSRGGKNMKVTGAEESQAQVVNTAGTIYGKNIHNYGRQDPVYSEDVQLLPDEFFQINRLRARTKEEVECMTAGMVRVSAVDDVLEMLESREHWVTITGNAGDGKTTVGFLALKELVQKNARVYSVYEPGECDLISKVTEDKIIMCDDRFGENRADPKKIETWIDVLQKLFRFSGGKNTQVIFISKKNVMNASKVNLGRLEDTMLDCVIDLSDRKRTEKRERERLDILNYHLRHEQDNINQTAIENVSKMEIPHGFEHCCEMFAKLRSKHHQLNIEDFFKSPLKCLDMTTKVLYNRNCKDLFQLMIKNKGKCDLFKLKNDAKRKAMFEIQSEQEGSYVTVLVNGICKFSHQSLYESVLSVINETEPLLCVQHATLSVIRERMIIPRAKGKDSSNNPCFIVVKPIPVVLKALAERFREEILKGDYSVFKHRLCKSKQFCKTLVSCCVSTDGGQGSSDDNDDYTYELSKQHSKRSLKERKQNISKRFINDKGVDGETMLWTALKSGNMAAMCILVKHGADGNTRNREGRTPLHFVCCNDQRGVDDDYDSDVTFPLLDTIKLIITEGRADVNLRDFQGKTALQYLCERKYDECHTHVNVNVDAIRVIVTEGRAHVNIQDESGKTALHYLCENPDNESDTPDSHKVNVDAIRVIVTEGRGHVNIQDRSGKTALHYLCENPDNESDTPDSHKVNVDAIRVIVTEGRGHVNIQDESGKTALHYLCENPDNESDTPDSHKVNVDAIRVIVTEGRGHVNTQDESGKTALHYLCENLDNESLTDSHKVIVDAIRVIVTEGRGHVNIQDESGKTVLHYLCKNLNNESLTDSHKVNVDAIRVIVTEGRGHVNIQERSGKTVLHYLFARKPIHAFAIELMVKYWKSDITLGDKYGRTPLHYLFRHEDVNANLIQVMLDKQHVILDVNKPDHFKSTPLHYLMSHEDIDETVLKLVISEGKGDLNLCEQNKSTPLHYLCANSSLQLDTLDLVIKEGKGDFNRGDEHGTTPFHYLCRNGKLEHDVVLQIVNTAKGDINKQDENGITPLHVLCKGSLPMKDILTLINQGDKADMYGNTPLHFLCRRRGINVEELQQQLEQIPETDRRKENNLGYTALDYLTDQDNSLPWTDGMIARSAADLVLCRLKHGDNWTVVIGRAMILNSERVHKYLQVEDFGRVLTNLEESGDRNSPGQFSRFWGTCSSPVPVPPSPSPLTTPPSYWETSSTLTRRERGELLLQMGVKLGRRNMDERFCVSLLPHSVCVSVTDACYDHPDRLCIRVLRTDQEDSEEHQDGECVSLSLPTPGVEFTLTFGLVLDVGRGRVGFIDVERGQLLCKVDLQMKEEVFPMFYVDPYNDCCATRMKLVSGREICVTDRKIHLIQQALSD